MKRMANRMDLSRRDALAIGLAIGVGGLGARSARAAANWNQVVANLKKVGFASVMVLGVTDGKHLASSPGFSLKPTEGQALLNRFKDPESTIKEGIVLAGLPYAANIANMNSIRATRSPGGAVVEKSATAILIGLYDAKLDAAQAGAQIQHEADRLRKLDQ